MSWNIPLYSSGFPQAVQVRLPASMSVDELDLHWSAMTVGRPNLTAVLSHGQFSVSELVWRRGMVDANIRMTPSVAGLHNSPAFEALDMTEKGWVNFSLGMLFTKLCAAKHLDMPWLFHFKWFRTQVPVAMAPGGSTPDFIGLNPLTLQHHVLEAKGRNAGFSAATLRQAKIQTWQPIAVNGQPCGMHIGALLYRLAGSRLAMAIVDPEPEGPDIWQAADVQATWAEYYQVAWGLADLGPQHKGEGEVPFGIAVDFDPGARPFIERLVRPDPGDGWKKARDGLVAWSARRLRPDEQGVSEGDAGRRTYGDGIRLSYSERRRAEIPEKVRRDS